MNHGVTIVSLYYDPNDNSITHEDGRIIDDISHLISPTDLESLKRVGGTQYIESDEDRVTYELIVPIPDSDIITFYYDKEQNIMLDCEGYIMYNIFSYIKPLELILFKQQKDDMRLYGRNGHIIELIYPKMN